MNGCIFCKVINGELPSAKVFEDDNFVAILDIAPVHQGHTLVIPKDHHVTFMDMPVELAKDFSHVVKVVAESVEKATHAEGLNLSTNVRSAAGQTVDHAHFHIIPRYKGDGLKMWPQKKYEDGEMNKVAEDIRKEF